MAVSLQAASLSLVLCIFGFYRFYSRVERSIANPFTDGVVFNNNNNNNRISIAPYGRNFRGAGGRSDQCSVKA